MTPPSLTQRLSLTPGTVRWQTRRWQDKWRREVKWKFGRCHLEQTGNQKWGGLPNKAGITGRGGRAGSWKGTRQGDETGRRAPITSWAQVRKQKLISKTSKKWGKRKLTSQFGEVMRAACGICCTVHRKSHKHWQSKERLPAFYLPQPQLPGSKSLFSSSDKEEAFRTALTTLTYPLAGSNWTGEQRAAHWVPWGVGRGAQHRSSLTAPRFGCCMRLLPPVLSASGQLQCKVHQDPSMVLQSGLQQHRCSRTVWGTSGFDRKQAPKVQPGRSNAIKKKNPVKMWNSQLGKRGNQTHTYTSLRVLHHFLNRQKKKKKKIRLSR